MVNKGHGFQKTEWEFYSQKNGVRAWETERLKSYITGETDRTVIALRQRHIRGLILKGSKMLLLPTPFQPSYRAPVS